MFELVCLLAVVATARLLIDRGKQRLLVLRQLLWNEIYILISSDFIFQYFKITGIFNISIIEILFLLL